MLVVYAIVHDSQNYSGHTRYIMSIHSTRERAEDELRKYKRRLFKEKHYDLSPRDPEIEEWFLDESRTDRLERIGKMNEEIRAVSEDAKEVVRAKHESAWRQMGQPVTPLTVNPEASDS